MSRQAMSIRATMIALALAAMAAGQTNGASSSTTTVGSIGDSRDTGSGSTTTVPSSGQVRVADKFAAPFVTMAGSRENAVALATALRTGSPVTLTYTSTTDGATTTTTTTFTPPTKPMGWGNVSHSLALAQIALNKAGISNPTGAELQAALLGDTIKTADGNTVTFAGVLQQRADGMGWGRIAQSYGTTMGAVNRGVKAPTVATTTTKAPAPSRTASTVTVTGAGQAGAATRGLTTAGGTAAGTGHGTKGITTATGASNSSNSGGIVSADGSARGNGNAYGRGIVTASGSATGVAAGRGASGVASNSIVTGAGGAGGGAVTADPGGGAAAGNSHGKGKGGG